LDHCCEERREAYLASGDHEADVGDDAPGRSRVDSVGAV
jgi:hypothetical protein